MVFWNRPVRESALLIAAICLSFSAGSGADSESPQAQAGQQPSSQTPAAARPVGTIKSISGKAITLTTDAGSDVTVQVQDATKLVRIAPGQKDLKEATPIQLADVQPGDRILVRGKLAEDGKSVLAAHKNAVAGLNVRQLDGRGFLQVLLPGRNSNEFRGVLDLDGHVASRICRQRYGFAGDRLNCSDGPRRGGGLRGRLLPRLGLGRFRIRATSRAETQANRCDQQC